jgi:hypothetical protein
MPNSGLFQLSLNTMKGLRCIALLLPTLFLSVINTVSGQAPEKIPPGLVDQFGEISCDEFQARIQNFTLQLSKSSASHGYFVITGSNSFLRRKLFWENEFLTLLKVLKYGPSIANRISTIRGPESGEFKVQFWVIPPTQKAPDFKPTSWTFTLPPKSKSFLISSNEGEVCFDELNPDVVTDYFNANPGMRLNVAIYYDSSSRRRESSKVARAKLKSIPAHHVRYFYKWSTEPSNIIEYWLVPKKRK